MFAFRKRKGPLASVTNSSYYMLCQLRDGVIPDEEDLQLSEVKTQRKESQRDEVQTKFTTLTCKTSIR